MLKNPVLEAKGAWKGYRGVNGLHRWILQGVNLELKEGEFISILGKPASGKTTLLKMLSFFEFPDKGEIYFQGRLVGKSGAEELEHMHNERVWLIEQRLPAEQIITKVKKNLAAVLLDEPAGCYNSGSASPFLKNIHFLNSCGIAVAITTQNPAAASRAPSVYKLNGGKIVKITGATR